MRPPMASLLSPPRLPPLLAAAFAAFVSAAAISYYLLSGDKHNADFGNSSNQEQLFTTIEHTVDMSKESAHRIINRMKHTGIAASLLWQLLRSVFSLANHEVWSGFEFRVASFLADIATVNASRRAAIVVAGGGKVIDWLLETVVVTGEGNGTQAEAARALAYLIPPPGLTTNPNSSPDPSDSLVLGFKSTPPPHSSR